MVNQKTNAQKNREDWLDDLLYREDLLYSNRINYFFLSQSLLLLSYVTVLATNSGKMIAFFISILSFFVTAFFIIIFHRTVDYIRYLRDDLKYTSNLYNEIWVGRKHICGANILVGEGLSILFFTLWICLSFLALPFNIYSITFFIIILFCFIPYSLYYILKESHFPSK